jgi:hypothetical protein
VSNPLDGFEMLPYELLLSHARNLSADAGFVTRLLHKRTASANAWKALARKQRTELERLRTRFEEVYALRSKVTVEFLREHGQRGVRCECEAVNCPGWQMENVR